MCLHALRLLRSMLVEEEAFLLSSALLDPDLQARVGRLTSAANASLRLAAQQTLEDLRALQQVPWDCGRAEISERPPVSRKWL